MAAQAFAHGHLYQTREDEDDAITDARRMGASAAQIEDLKKHLSLETNEFIGVWPENAEAMSAFVAASNQWRTVVRQYDGRIYSFYQSLDYASAMIAWAACHIKPTRDFMDQIMVIEGTVATVWNAQVAA